MIAVENGNVETAKMLFECGAKLSDIFDKDNPKKISSFDKVLSKNRLVMMALIDDQLRHDKTVPNKSEYIDIIHNTFVTLLDKDYEPFKKQLNEETIEKTKDYKRPKTNLGEYKELLAERKTEAKITPVKIDDLQVDNQPIAPPRSIRVRR